MANGEGEKERILHNFISRLPPLRCLALNSDVISYRAINENQLDLTEIHAAVGSSNAGSQLTTDATIAAWLLSNFYLTTGIDSGSKVLLLVLRSWWCTDHSFFFSLASCERRTPCSAAMSSFLAFPLSVFYILLSAVSWLGRQFPFLWLMNLINWRFLFLGKDPKFTLFSASSKIFSFICWIRSLPCTSGFWRSGVNLVRMASPWRPVSCRNTLRNRYWLILLLSVCILRAKRIFAWYLGHLLENFENTPGVLQPITTIIESRQKSSVAQFLIVLSQSNVYDEEESNTPGLLGKVTSYSACQNSMIKKRFTNAEFESINSYAHSKPTKDKYTPPLKYFVGFFV